MSFAGFGKGAVGFFAALAENQNRDWFQANRHIYEAEARAPMEALVEALAFAFEVHGIPLTGDAKRSLFRINRDVRFSKDKSPYKTQVSAVLSRDGTRGGMGILYVQVGADGGFVALGFYEPEPDDLAALRQAIAADPKGWAALVDGLARHKLALSQDSVLARMPKGFEAHADAPYAAALKLKRFTVSRRIPAKRLTSPDLVGDVVGFAEAGMELLAFGRAAIDRGRTGSSPRPSPGGRGR